MNNKLYGKLGGRCSIHGARTHPEKFWRGHDSICEVTAEAAYIRKTKAGKRQGRRKARRLNWEMP